MFFLFVLVFLCFFLWFVCGFPVLRGTGFGGTSPDGNCVFPVDLCLVPGRARLRGVCEGSRAACVPGAVCAAGFSGEVCVCGIMYSSGSSGPFAAWLRVEGSGSRVVVPGRGFVCGRFGLCVFAAVLVVCLGGWFRVVFCGRFFCRGWPGF